MEPGKHFVWGKARKNVLIPWYTNVPINE